MQMSEVVINNGATPVRVDIVADFVCPFCIIAYLQLERASANAKVPLNVQWHPFELNPQMASGGENHIDYMHKHYGVSPEETRESRRKLKKVGDRLGFTFGFSDETRIMNTFKAHKLTAWAFEIGKGHELALEIYKAYFTNGESIEDNNVLIRAAQKVGLGADEVRNVLHSDAYIDSTEIKKQFGVMRGVTGVPYFIFEGEHVLKGAQGEDTYEQALLLLKKSKHCVL